MLTRLYVDNYKCLVNLEFRPQRVQLITGLNGVGKTAVLGVLSLLHDFVNGDGKTSDLFQTSTLTRWQSHNLQTFEMSVTGNGGRYTYTLEVEHNLVTRQSRVHQEKLSFDNRPLFGLRLGTVQLYRDDFSLGPTFSFDWTASGLGVIGSRQDNRRLVWFREWLSKLQVVRVDPFAMSATTEREQDRALPNMANFASWYRHLVLEMPDLVSQLQDTLAELWEGFDGLKLEKAGETVRLLKARFRYRPDDGQDDLLAEYNFDELSDGQRDLIVLYSLLGYASRSKQALLCLDEPVNFVALAEIQPWLGALVEAAEDQDFQVLLASHHPELVDYLAPERSVQFERVRGGPTRVREFPTEPGSRLTPSEILARGWGNE
jgi:predicted ATPase